MIQDFLDIWYVCFVLKDTPISYVFRIVNHGISGAGKKGTVCNFTQTVPKQWLGSFISDLLDDQVTRDVGEKRKKKISCLIFFLLAKLVQAQSNLLVNNFDFCLLFV